MLIVLDDLTEQGVASGRARVRGERRARAATPLTTIIGAVEVLQAGAKDDPSSATVRAHERGVGAACAACTCAADACASAWRSRSAAFEPIALRPLLQEVADDLRPASGVVVGIARRPPGAIVNRDLLEQVLRNLGENAAKHTQQGHVMLSAYAVGNTLRLEVEDTGVGMTADTQRHVFDRFYRGQDRDAEGFGLGLAIVRQTVRSLDGRIELDSAPGKGTRVRIVLEQAQVREAVPA